MSGRILEKKTVADHLFAERYHYYGSDHHATNIKFISYNTDKENTVVIEGVQRDFANLIKPDAMNWFQVTGLTDQNLIYDLCGELGVVPVDMKSILTPCHAAKIDDYSGRVLIVAPSCFYDDNNVINEEHNCIHARENVVITFTEKSNVKFDTILDAINNNVMGIRNNNHTLLIAFILNAIFSEIIGTAVRVEGDLEKIDDILLDAHHSSANIGHKIQQCRHANLVLQKISTPLKKEFPKLMKTEIVNKDDYIMLVYNELYNQLDFIVLTNANSKELLSSMRDLYAATNDFRTNTIMKRLTVVSTLFIPVTFIVGLWGMNFRMMPELEWEGGYLFAWIVLVITALGTWYYMKRNKWF